LLRHFLAGLFQAFACMLNIEETKAVPTWPESYKDTKKSVQKRKPFYPKKG